MKPDSELKDLFEQAEFPCPKQEVEKNIMATASNITGTYRNDLFTESRPSSDSKYVISILTGLAAIALILVFLTNFNSEQPSNITPANNEDDKSSADIIEINPEFLFGDGELVIFENSKINHFELGKKLDDFTSVGLGNLKTYSLFDIWPDRMLLEKDGKLFQLGLNDKNLISYDPGSEDLLSPAAIENLFSRRKAPLEQSALDTVRFQGDRLDDVFEFISAVSGYTFVIKDQTSTIRNINVTLALNTINVKQFITILSSLYEIAFLPDPRIANRNKNKQVIWVVTKERGEEYLNPRREYLVPYGFAMNSCCKTVAEQKDFRKILAACFRQAEYMQEFVSNNSMNITCRRRTISGVIDLLVAFTDIASGKHNANWIQALRGQESREYMRLMKDLEKRETSKVDFVNEPLETVVEFLSDMCGYNYVMTDTVRVENILVAMHLGKVNALELLRNIKEKSGVRFYFQHKIILVAKDDENIFKPALCLLDLHQAPGGGRNIEECIQLFRKSVDIGIYFDGIEKKEGMDTISQRFMPLGARVLYVDTSVINIVQLQMVRLLEAASRMEGGELDEWIKKNTPVVECLSFE
ncbi:hypothetical protein ACFL54_02935 [Planctomycetota bacterium]